MITHPSHGAACGANLKGPTTRFGPVVGRQRVRTIALCARSSRRRVAADPAGRAGARGIGAVGGVWTMRARVIKRRVRTRE